MKRVQRGLQAGTVPSLEPAVDLAGLPNSQLMHFSLHSLTLTANKKSTGLKQFTFLSVCLVILWGKREGICYLYLKCVKIHIKFHIPIFPWNVQKSGDYGQLCGTGTTS